MQLKTKINLKEYVFYSLPSTLICFALCRNLDEILGIIVVYLGTIINQLMLVTGVRELVQPCLEVSSKKRIKRIIFLFVGKLVILFGTLSLGVHLMGERVLIALINYVVLIFVLVVFGMNKKERNDKK